MRFHLLILLLLLSGHPTWARSSKAVSTSAVIQGAITYLEHHQKTQDPLYNDGEWEVKMTSYLLPRLIGVGRWVDEPTAFATSSILNLLEPLSKLQPQNSHISKMVERALPSLKFYESGPLYNYYNETTYQGVRVRLPRDPRYLPKHLIGLTNIPDDADTTSVTYQARLRWEKDVQIPDEVLESLNRYRDLNRKPNYHNFLQNQVNTGAFLTWQWDERQRKSLTAPPQAGTRIPLGMNDVDCVVNANVMTMMSMVGATENPGYQAACRYLNKIVSRQHQNMCGIYYPNAYTPFYAMSNAYQAGATCLERSKKKIIKTLLESQDPDGAWVNISELNRNEEVQSTAMAILTIMNFYGDEIHRQQGARQSVYAGTKFLLSTVRKNKDQFYWDGEVFFSAVAQARNTVLWRSTPYTTALVTLALAKAQSLNLTD